MNKFDFHNTIGYAVLQTSRMLTNKINCNMAEIGDDITIEQAMVLAFIDEQKNADMIQQDIAEVMDKNKSAILRTVDHLEKKGFAKRVAVPNDRRKNRLVITKAGEQVVDNVKKMVGRKESLIKKDFTDKEIDTFFKILETIRNSA